MCTKLNKYKKLQQQFLCCYPINKMTWSSLQLPLELDAQAELIAATCAHPLNTRWPVRRRYQEAFVKRLLELLKNQEDIHDDVYGHLCGPFTDGDSATQAYAYKHYVLPEPHNSTVTLHESNSFVSEGTTGLCTWEAELALADYLLEHSSLVQGKNILELGAGAGLCGILLKHCALQTKQVLLTDGSEPCVQLMRENIALNFASKTSESAPQCALLRWHEVASFQWQDFAAPDLLLAADVIYDDTQFEALLNAMDYIFDMRNNGIEMLLASTVRNVDTLHNFMEQLAARQYKVTPCANVAAATSHFCRDHTAAVQIICIRR